MNEENQKMINELRDTINEKDEAIEQLKNELQNQRPATAHTNLEWEDEKIGLELQIDQNNARINALEQEAIE